MLVSDADGMPELVQGDARDAIPFAQSRTGVVADGVAVARYVKVQGHVYDVVLLPKIVRVRGRIGDVDANASLARRAGSPANEVDVARVFPRALPFHHILDPSLLGGPAWGVPAHVDVLEIPLGAVKPVEILLPRSKIVFSLVDPHTPDQGAQRRQRSAP